MTKRKIFPGFLLALLYLTLNGASCGQQLKYITLIPGSPTISTPGVATAVQPGSVAVTATLGSLAGAAVLTVSSATLQTISVAPVNPVLPEGIVQPFSATGTYSDGTVRDVSSIVTWSFSGSGALSADATGRVTTGNTPASSLLTATFGTVSGSSRVTVDGTIVLTALSIGTSTTLPAGLNRQYAATGIFSDGSEFDLTSAALWSSFDNAIATVSPTGLVTAVSPGSTALTATVGTVVSGPVIITVSAATLVSIAVTSGSSLTVPNGRNIQFAATGTYSDSTTYDLTSLVIWNSGTPVNAFINNFGLATATGPAFATSAITATTASGSGTLSGSAQLTVGSATIQSLTILPATPTIPVGATQRFSASVLYSDGTTYDVSSLVTWSTGNATNPIATMFTGMVQQFRAYGTYNGGTVDITTFVSWSSDHPNVAMILPSGYALAIDSGSTLITAAMDGVSASTLLTVSPSVALKSITVTPANLTLTRGTSQQFTATGNYFDGSSNVLTTFVTWSSNAPSVAEISILGAATGVATGTSTISATLGQFSGSTILNVQ